MSDTFLFLISLGITALGLVGSWGAYRRRGAASGMRGAAWSLVPMAAYSTGLTEFFTDLVFSPVKWAGVAIAGLAVVLYVVSGMMLRSGQTGGAQVEEGSPKSAGKDTKAPKARKRKGKGEIEQSKPDASGLDSDLGDIEEILKRRGIS
jgi:membrane protein implicated in regulation of membrane protease activity